MLSQHVRRQRKIIVEAPASTANVGPGFDVFALALESPKDKVSISESGDHLKIYVKGLTSSEIPTKISDNTAGIVALKMIEDYHLPEGLEIEITKGIPVGMGMGSSAASAAAVAFGINRLFSLDIEQNSLVEYASKGEVASAGKPHADNVSASLLGGFTIIRSYDPMDVIRVDPPKNLGICIASPKVFYGAKKTAQFRAVIPLAIELERLVHNVGNASALVAAIFNNDLKLFGRALNDSVVEPARSKLIPSYAQVKKSAMDAGAVGVTISGAGPSMVAFYDVSILSGKEIGISMCDAFNTAKVESSYMCTKPGEGVKVVHSD